MNTPCEFEQDRSKEVVKDVNGLKDNISIKIQTNPDHVSPIRVGIGQACVRPDPPYILLQTTFKL